MDTLSASQHRKLAAKNRACYIEAIKRGSSGEFFAAMAEHHTDHAVALSGTHPALSIMAVVAIEKMESERRHVEAIRAADARAKLNAAIDAVILAYMQGLRVENGFARKVASATVATAIDDLIAAASGRPESSAQTDDAEAMAAVGLLP